MNTVVLLKPFGQHERGRVIAPGGVIAEKLIRSKAAFPVSDADVDEFAEKPFGGIPKMSEATINRMMAAPVNKGKRR